VPVKRAMHEEGLPSLSSPVLENQYLQIIALRQSFDA
jgi:hypothetical protein